MPNAITIDSSDTRHAGRPLPPSNDHDLASLRPRIQALMDAHLDCASHHAELELHTDPGMGGAATFVLCTPGGPGGTDLERAVRLEFAPQPLDGGIDAALDTMRAAATHMPVPEVIARDDGDTLGRAGVVLNDHAARALTLDDPRIDDPARTRLLCDLARRLARLHKEGLGRPSPDRSGIRARLDTLRRKAGDDPLASLALAVLAGNAPEIRLSVPGHGVWQPAHIRVDTDKESLLSVSGWWHGGEIDPHEELASLRRLAPNRGDGRAVVAAWEVAADETLDGRVLDYYELLHDTSRRIDLGTSLATAARGDGALDGSQLEAVVRAWHRAGLSLWARLQALETI